MTRARRGGPPRRTPSRRAVRRELLVFVEGRRTEELYLNEWRRAYRDRVIVKIDGFRGGPLQLVEHAVDWRKSEARAARRGQGRPYDEIWCVFDIDEHPNIDRADALAAAHGILLAISNPCIELWFLLHFEDQTGWIHRNKAGKKSQELLGCGKVLTPDAFKLLADRHDDAVARAKALDAKHHGDGSPPGENPSSSVWRLIDSIRMPGAATE